jgi:hypothetical protein
VRFRRVVRARSHLQFAVIVTMRPVMVVQMPVHQVVDVISMRHSFMAAVCAVNVTLVMSGAIVRGRAFLWIGRTHVDGMIVDVIAVREVQMAVVKIIRVSAVLDSGVAAVGAMLMAVGASMRLMSLRHSFSSFHNAAQRDASYAAVGDV